MAGYQHGSDEVIICPSESTKVLSGCGGKELVKINGEPSSLVANGYAVNFVDGAVSQVDPMYHWNGSVIDVTVNAPELISDGHGTDLTAADAFTLADNPNHS